jgi:hypothetical protein
MYERIHTIIELDIVLNETNILYLIIVMLSNFFT